MTKCHVLWREWPSRSVAEAAKSFRPDHLPGHVRQGHAGRHLRISASVQLLQYKKASSLLEEAFLFSESDKLVCPKALSAFGRPCF